MKAQRPVSAIGMLLLGSVAAQAGILSQHSAAALLTITVPEPGSLVLTGGALLAVWGFGRWKSRKK